MIRRLALISDHASPLASLGDVDAGGQNVYVEHVARQMAARGIEVDVFTRRSEPDEPTIVALCPGARVVHIAAGPRRYMPKEHLLGYMDEFAENLVRFVRTARGYDLVHANFFMSGLVATRIDRTLGVPFVVTFHALGKIRRLHQGGADRFPSERISIEHHVIDEARRIIAECPQDRHDLVAHYRADVRKIDIVPCGFDPREFYPQDKRAVRRRLGWDPEEPVVVHVGRIVPRKGVDNVIEGFARYVATERRAARLVIVGGETNETSGQRDVELERLKALARDLGNAHRVSFLGRRSHAELCDYYAAGDVFVTTPWYEPFGITPLEAMASGTPVIAANVGGLKYSVRDGVTGYLVEPKNPCELAERLQRILGDYTGRERMSRRALEWVNAKFTWTRVADALLGVYERATDAAELPSLHAGYDFDAATAAVR